MFQYSVAIVLFCSIFVFAPATLQCMPGFETPGVTVPKGDIKLEVGNDLVIYCVLDLEKANVYKPGLNASNLLYMRNKAPLAEEHVVDIVNQTTIKLTIYKPQPVQDKFYYCHLQVNETNTVPVCVNKVSVGYPPGKDLDFSCLSYNWENLTCTWTGQKNYVNTDYDVSYRSLSGKVRPYSRCPKIEEDQYGNYTCTWRGDTEPLYRIAPSKFMFSINITNALGNQFIEQEFMHHENVIPAEPKINQVLPYPHGVFLEWEAPRNLFLFPGGLTNRVKYKSQFDSTKDDNFFEDDWMTGDVSKIVKLPDTQIFQLNLTDLTYSYAWYDVRIRLKSGVASNETEKWSKNASSTFRTPAKLPDRPPKTNIGSFEIHESNNTRNILLYWQQIKNYEQNGANFGYKVINISEDGVHKILSPDETTSSYVKYNDLSYNSYNFTIVSINNIGQSIDHSYIFVPSRNNINRQPTLFTKTAYGDFKFELSWKAPTDNISSYTIFWCENDKDRPYPCKGLFSWEEVSGSVTAHNVTVPVSNKTYQFAISANAETFSSGMVWASCTVLHDQIVGKMNTVWINRVESSFIEVGWRLDCSNRIGVQISFRIYYCPIIEAQTMCKQPMKNITIPDSNVGHGNITGLLPYTTYKISISVVTKSGEGPQSDDMYNTTKAAAPSSSPLDVKVFALTNSSFTISWKPPRRLNGYLTEYKVHYTSHNVTQVNNIPPKESLQYTVKGLKPYTSYSVQLSACTIACSEKSAAITIMTLMGYPEQIVDVKIRYTNDSRVNLTWAKPEYPGGNLDVYEIRQESEYNNGYNSSFVYFSNATTMITSRLCEDDSKIKYLFYVRGINIFNPKPNLNNETKVDVQNLLGKCDKDVVCFKGKWSEAEENNICFNNNSSSWTIYWIIIGIGTPLSIVFFFFSCKRVWARCKNMQDIEVKFPPGINANMEKEPRYPLNNWPIQQKPSNKIQQKTPDEVSLLPDKSCSGGHSTTPSIPSNDEQSQTEINSNWSSRQTSMKNENKCNAENLLEPNPPQHNNKINFNDTYRYSFDEQDVPTSMEFNNFTSNKPQNNMDINFMSKNLRNDESKSVWDTLNKPYTFVPSPDTNEDSIPSSPSSYCVVSNHHPNVVGHSPKKTLNSGYVMSIPSDMNNPKKSSTVDNYVPLPSERNTQTNLSDLTGGYVPITQMDRFQPVVDASGNAENISEIGMIMMDHQPADVSKPYVQVNVPIAQIDTTQRIPDNAGPHEQHYVQVGLQNAAGRDASPYVVVGGNQSYGLNDDHRSNGLTPIILDNSQLHLPQIVNVDPPKSKPFVERNGISNHNNINHEPPSTSTPDLHFQPARPLTDRNVNGYVPHMPLNDQN